MFEIFIQPTYAYNELEREMQLLQLSYLIRDLDKNTIVREDLSFPPVFGVDESLLLWLGIREKVKFGSNWKQEINRVVDMINSEYSKSKVISWYNELESLPKIQSQDFFFVHNKVNKNMRKAVKEILGEELITNNANEKLDFMIRIYDTINYQKDNITFSTEELKSNISTDVFET